MFKPVGKFYDDIETLTKMLNLKIHPALKPAVYPTAEGQEIKTQEQIDEERHKNLDTITLYKHRLDKNSMKAMFLCLPASPNIHTLK